MKKIIALALIVLTMLTLLCSCGGKRSELYFGMDNYKYAYVVWPDGTSECLELEATAYYGTAGTQLQLLTTDGKMYVFSITDCVLTSEKRPTTQPAE